MKLTNKQTRTAQRSLFAQMATGEKSNQNGSPGTAQSMNLRAYVHTRDFLWRMLACFPGDMPLVEALRQAPQVIFGRKEVAL